MHKTIPVLVAFTLVACGEVAAEPIQAGEAALSFTDIEVGDDDSDDPYACQVVAPSPGDGIYPFVSLGELAYGAQCKLVTDEQPRQCWYTSPADCDSSEQACGGFVGGVDLDTGFARLEGGQHMLCEYPCISDEQCPAPTSGSARASCMRHPEFNPLTDGGSCMLGCGNGETCPDGFLCIDPGLAFGQSDGSFWPAPAQCVQYKPAALVATEPQPQ